MSIAKVEPEQMPRLAWCAGLLNRSAADELGAWVARQRYPLRQRDVSVHVMARETKLPEIISDVEGTWGRNVSKVYFHVDKLVAQGSHSVSRGRWGVSENLLPPAEVKARARALSADERRREGGGRGGGAIHRIAALNLPERPNSQGEHWTISHDKVRVRVS